ncbi:hypothetical protein [Flagellimonas myxillae]|uniref:hypothetical protein n=1 Tax=Flagellimonas myxillae TaxID=2942214 RepID=UPI00201F2BAB|nr:hypothetical protein [Muricauda myxillae]MCL6267832.1 hypothetical protein [Muricauda myxillae]
MTYKIKSLIYFICFLTASSIYYVVEQHEEFQQQLRAKELVKTEFEDNLEDEDTVEEMHVVQK